MDALGLQAEDIPSYVTSLGPLVLRSDTVGTSHGYTEGRFLAYPAVLQAGTAVFVNSYGEPKVKCYSGNPLTPAVSSSQASYSGPAWEHFTPTSVTVIDRTPTVINNYTFVNVHQGTTIHRPGKTPGPNDDNWHLVTLTGAGGSRQDLPHPELGAVDPRCRALLAADEHQAVECALLEAEKAAPSFDNRWLIALADYQLGQRARQQGEAGRAEVSYQRRLPGGARGSPPWRRRIAGGSDDSRGRAPKLRSGHPPPRRHRGLGLVRWPTDQTGYETLLTRAHEVPDDSAFEIAWAQGEALTAD